MTKKHTIEPAGGRFHVLRDGETLITTYNTPNSRSIAEEICQALNGASALKVVIEWYERERRELLADCNGFAKRMTRTATELAAGAEQDSPHAIEWAVKSSVASEPGFAGLSYRAMTLDRLGDLLRGLKERAS